MRELGYVYGEQFVTEPRGAEGQPERYAGLAAELVHLQMDVIVAAGPALMQATSTIRVVMAASSDPVGLGHVRNLGHPGGNVTGLPVRRLANDGLKAWQQVLERGYEGLVAKDPARAALGARPS